MIKVDSFSFQGVSGAYSEQAGKNIFPNATSIPCATFEDMFEHVRSGKSEAAMVPIENSLAGRVADTQSCLLYTSPSPRDRQKSRMPSSA